MKFSVFSKSLFSSQSGNEPPVDNKTQSLCNFISSLTIISELLIDINLFEIKLIVIFSYFFKFNDC